MHPTRLPLLAAALAALAGAAPAATAAAAQAPSVSFVGTPVVRYAIAHGDGQRYAAIGAVFRVSRDLVRSTNGGGPVPAGKIAEALVVGPHLRAGQTLTTTLFDGLTPTTIGRRSGHCYSAEAYQLSNRIPRDGARWRLGVFAASDGGMTVSTTTAVTVRRGATGDAWQVAAARRLGC